jgi:hypothetical protein
LFWYAFPNMKRLTKINFAMHLCVSTVNWKFFYSCCYQTAFVKILNFQSKRKEFSSNKKVSETNYYFCNFISTERVKVDRTKKNTNAVWVLNSRVSGLFNTVWTGEIWISAASLHALILSRLEGFNSMQAVPSAMESQLK